MSDIAANEHAPIIMSEAAGRRIAKVLDGEKEMVALRVSVEGGGCSGFSYKFDLTDNISEDDLKLIEAGGTVVIDPVSQMYMSGSVIDFVDDLIGQSFQIRNPNATASCGCGTSFAM